MIRKPVFVRIAARRCRNDDLAEAVSDCSDGFGIKFALRFSLGLACRCPIVFVLHCRRIVLDVPKLFRVGLLVQVVCAIITLWLVAGAHAIVRADDGFRPIFDGQSLDGWSSGSEHWAVIDGAIVGEISESSPLDKNLFLVWEHGELDDFELRLKFRIAGGKQANSGIQVRSQPDESGHFVGYQADIAHNPKYMGCLYDEHTSRGVLAARGQEVTYTEDVQRTTRGLGDPRQLMQCVDLEGWNDYHIKAIGNEISVSINGHVMSRVIDHDPQHFDRSGKLALQLHSGPPMKIAFKDIRLKRLPLHGGQKKIVFLAGKASHGWGAHEHRAGCLLLADGLNAAAASKQNLPVLATVYENGWPQDPTALDNADTVVVYTDGGERHYLHSHGEAFENVMRRGVGLVCNHYGVEIPKGLSGQRFLNWIGGYFETDWSVNPTWTAKFESIPDHPVTAGVNPFEIHDEWYYHMRFSPQMTRVTPVLSALPPAETLSRKDGPHHNNPYVRKSVLEQKQPQHLAWAFVRGDGRGRGFGFTGGHFHRNWQNDDFRRLMLNAIAWTAHVTIPQGGIQSTTPTDGQLDANQDFPKPL